MLVDLHGDGAFVLADRVKLTAVGTKSDWHAQALSHAGVHPEQWLPGLGFEKDSGQQAVVRRVYDYYRDTFLRDSQHLLWAGLGRMAGGAVYSGLIYLQEIIEAAEYAKGTTAGRLGYTNLSLTSVTFLVMHKAVFDDLAWQHEAFLSGGIEALELLNTYSTESGIGAEETIPLQHLGAWRQIESGDITGGNLALLDIEQRSVLQQGWDVIDQFDFVGVPVGWLTVSPLPNGLSFTDFTGSHWSNVAEFDQRWEWIVGDMWGKWTNLTDTQRRDLAKAALGTKTGNP